MGATGDPEGLQGHTVYQGSQVRDGQHTGVMTCMDEIAVK